MYRISVYNEKGGVGKTTVSVLLASHLAYVKGRRVCVLDFDAPTYHFSELRTSEERFLLNPRSPLSVWMSGNGGTVKPYDVLRVPTTSGSLYQPEEIFPMVMGIRPEDYDFLIFDFPGRFSQEEPVSLLAANGCLDFVAIPMDTDTQARRSALVIADALHRQGIRCCCFWNRVSAFERSGSAGRLSRGAEPFLQRGIPVMDAAVREIRKFSRDSDEQLFVRSTMCFPERYVSQWSPSLIPFLESLEDMITQEKQR